MHSSKLPVCLASASFFDPELLALYGILLLVLTGGGLIIYAAYRWYRNLKNAPSSRSDDLAQLTNIVEGQSELGADERERVLAALERAREGGDKKS
jgi:hypothetical protein